VVGLVDILKSTIGKLTAFTLKLGLDHWQNPHSTVDSNMVTNTLDQMMRFSMDFEYTAVNINFYMFYGGTSFGYSAGANIDSR